MPVKPHIFIDGIECKQCAKCKEVLELKMFSMSKHKKDGLVPYCKKCASEVKKKSIAKNPEKYKEAAREYNLKNKDKRNEQCRNYYYNNKEKMLAYSKEYKKANIERTRELDRERKREHKDEIKARMYDYFHSDHWKEIRKKNNKIYYSSEKGKNQRQVSSQKRYAIVKTGSANFTIKEWNYCKEYFDNECAYCGKKMERLTIDHFIPVSKNGEHVSNNIIPACRSCNSSKQHFDFSEWYAKQPFYSKDREEKILKYLNK